MYTVQYEILSSHLEPGYLHLNHAESLKWLEKGRLDYLEMIGTPNESLHAQNLFLVIAEVTVRYLREIFAGTITVTIDSVEFENKKMYIAQRVINHRGKTCIEARYDFRMLDGSTKRSCLFSLDFVQRMQGSSP